MDSNLQFEGDVLRATWIAMDELGVTKAGAEILFVALHGGWPTTALQIRIRDTRSTQGGTYTERWSLYADEQPVAAADAIADNAAEVMWSHQTGESMRGYDVWPQQPTTSAPDE